MALLPKQPVHQMIGRSQATNLWPVAEARRPAPVQMARSAPVRTQKEMPWNQRSAFLPPARWMSAPRLHKRDW